MRLALCAILLAAPLTAQTPRPARPDTNTVTVIRGNIVGFVSFRDSAAIRAVLVAAAKNAAADEGVVKIVASDSAYARDVAAVVPAATLAARRPSMAFTARLNTPVIYGDSARLDVIRNAVLNDGKHFTRGARVTLLKRNGEWVVISSRLTGIS